MLEDPRMSAIRNRLGAAVAMAAAAAITFGIAGEANAKPATTMRCNIGRWGYSPCSSDNVTVPPGKKVYVELKSAGGKEVRFEVKNMFGRKLGTGPWQHQDKDAYLLWTNNMGKPVRIDFFADAKNMLTGVSAVADVEIR
jgi:hypothetical protein